MCIRDSVETIEYDFIREGCTHPFHGIKILGGVLDTDDTGVIQ